jgi:hypothetical protein
MDFIFEVGISLDVAPLTILVLPIECRTLTLFSFYFSRVVFTLCNFQYDHLNCHLKFSCFSKKNLKLHSVKVIVQDSLLLK